MRPDKRLLQYGVYYPSPKSELLKIAVAVDTSGSVSDNQLDEFLTEVRNILQSFSSFRARLLACDAAVHADMMAVHDSDFESFLKCLSGSGGTDFRPVFKKIDDDPPEVLVYLTDGDGTYPDSNQPFDVIWVMNSYREPPFGRVIRLQGYEQ
jgi:predicted metal-dependent peptidase